MCHVVLDKERRPLLNAARLFIICCGLRGRVWHNRRFARGEASARAISIRWCKENSFMGESEVNLTKTYDAIVIGLAQRAEGRARSYQSRIASPHARGREEASY